MLGAQCLILEANQAMVRAMDPVEAVVLQGVKVVMAHQVTQDLVG